MPVLTTALLFNAAMGNGNNGAAMRTITLPQWGNGGQCNGGPMGLQCNYNGANVQRCNGVAMALDDFR